MVLKIPQTGNPFPAGRSLRAHPTNYTVSSGDTIYSIACLFGAVDPYAIATANGLSSPYTLTAGQSLYIP
jgi:LysM repeat protein